MRVSDQRTGTVASGDVTLFIRHFGTPGGAPILIFHGAQYYDSADWVDVGGVLSRDREVVAFDARGYGESSWSPSKNYSIDAGVEDALAVIDHLGWKKVAFMGHSRGGAFALLMASRFPARTASLILVDRPLHSPIGHPSADGRPSVGHKPKVYPTVDAAIADMSRDTRVPPGSKARARLDDILGPVEGGFVIRRRDPDYNNTTPVGSTSWAPKIVADDLWRELANVSAPTLIVRGTQSDRYPPSSLARLQKDFPYVAIVALDCGHDVANGAPDQLIAAVSGFLRDRVDTTSSASPRRT